MSILTRLGLAITLGACALACNASTDDPDLESSEDALDSSYGPQTDLGTLDEQCTNERNTADWKNWTCKGLDGYDLVVGQGFGRQRVSVRTAYGEYDLALGTKLPEAGTVGPKAEWRLTTPFDPSARGLIFRYASAKTSSLVVAKVTGGSACVYTTVAGSARTSAHDIVASDAFRDFVCPPRRPDTSLPPECGRLNAGNGLAHGAGLSSCSGAFSLYMQTDGNLVLYRNSDGAALWSSKTFGTGASHAVVDADGTFAIYDDSWGPNWKWSAKTTGNPGSFLVVQDDGNLVVYNAKNKAIWASRTVQ